jgi:hypothetical protein
MALVALLILISAGWWVIRIWTRPWEIVVRPVTGPVPKNRLLLSVQTSARHIDRPGGPGRPEVAKPAGGAILLVEPATGATRTLVNRSAWRASLSPDGRWLAYSTDDLDLQLFNFETAKSERLAEQLVGRPLWLPDGLALIFTYSAGPAWNARAPRETARFELASRKFTTLPIAATEELADISPDGRWLLTMSSRHFGQKPGFQLYLVAVDGSEERRLTQEGFNLYPRFAPGGQSIIFTRAEKTAGLICRMNVDGSGLRTLLDGVSASAEGRFSPDASYVLVRDPGRLEIAAADGSHRRPISIKKRLLGISLGGALESEPLGIGIAEWVP